MPPLPVYMDNHATTRVDPRVVEAMLPYFGERYGNAGSVSHAFGWDARDAVEDARARIAAAIGAEPREIVFTSGATESNNLALRGLADRQRRRGDHLVSVATEHKSVLDPLDRLSRRGYAVTLLPVAPHDSPSAGLIPAEQVAAALRGDTLVVSAMLANNEIGAIQPLAEIGLVCRAAGVPLHCDATQAVGKIPVDVEELQVDLLSFTAHKLYGPKGVGALYVRRGGPPVRLQPLLDGGGQEHGLRSGTLNVPGIVGFARAVELCLEEMPAEALRLAALRARLFAGLTRRLDGVTLNGPPLDSWEGEAREGEAPAEPPSLVAPRLGGSLALPSCDLPSSDHPLRLPGNLNLSFAYVDGEALMMSMKHLAVSSGSACTSANPEPSHVLRALGLGDDLTRASLRFGLGRFNNEADVDFAIDAVAEAVTRLRKMSSMA